MSLCTDLSAKGATLHPLLPPASETGGTGCCNPSVFADDDGTVLINVRHVEYTLYHSELKRFTHPWGPIQYVHPENDLKLRTNNYLGTYSVGEGGAHSYSPTKVDTTTLDVDPLWEFVGLEDARVVRWEGKLFLTGVRRDTTTNGQGRMELSELERSEDGLTYHEVSRKRIPIPGPTDGSYCEKNWMPVTDLPYTYVKWCSPVEVVRYDPDTGTTEQIHLGRQLVNVGYDLRGGSQVIPYGDGEHRFALVHQVDLFRSPIMGRKDARYRHRFVVWDSSWNVVHVSDAFDFLGAEVEFVCGAAWDLNSDPSLLITFGHQDNTAFLLSIPAEEALEAIWPASERRKRPALDWGPTDPGFIANVSQEVFVDNTYECVNSVKEGDIVMDIGASVGPFTYSVLDKNPSHVYCVEPSANLVPTLRKNVGSGPVTIIEKAILRDPASSPTPNIFFAGADSPPVPTITFLDLLKEHSIDRIDFLKIDCEGGEYEIFVEENMPFLLNHVGSIAAEFHVTTPELKERFKHFRDTYLTRFGDFKILSCTYQTIRQGAMIDLTKAFFEDSFVDAYRWQIMVHITNPPPRPPVIDCFPFFNEKELLELRIRLLRGKVDKFVITEANLTHSGQPKPFVARKTLTDLGLMGPDICIIEVNYPDSVTDHITQMDRAYSNNYTDSEWAEGVCRERMQRDAMLARLSTFPENAVFILSDCDEIMDPEYVDYYARLASSRPSSPIKVPLVNLQGRADLAPYDANNARVPWNRSMVVATKDVLRSHSPQALRGEFMIAQGNYVRFSGEPDAPTHGWHFSWMGDRGAKYDAGVYKWFDYIHPNESEVASHVGTYVPSEGSPDPLNTPGVTLRRYDITQLPAEILVNPRLKSYLLQLP